MGALYSLLWGGSSGDPNFDVPDKATGLSPREKAAVTSSWAIIKKDVKGNGEALFILFFTTFPEHQQLFSAFKNLSLEQLKGHQKLHAHASTVIYAITAVVDNLNDPSCLTEMLAKLGFNHAKHNVTEQGFKDLKLVLMKMLRMKLGCKLTPAVEAAWDKTLDVANTVIYKGLAQYNTTGTWK